MTRYEHQMLDDALRDLKASHLKQHQAIAALQLIFDDAERQLAAEDDANTSQAQQEVDGNASGDQRSL